MGSYKNRLTYFCLFFSLLYYHLSYFLGSIFFVRFLHTELSIKYKHELIFFFRIEAERQKILFNLLKLAILSDTGLSFSKWRSLWFTIYRTLVICVN